jgi:hypothetical protein
MRARADTISFGGSPPAMVEAGVNENSAKSTAFLLHVATSFTLNWYLENQTKATHGASSVTASGLCYTSPGLIVAMSSHGLAGPGYTGLHQLERQPIWL